MNQPGCFGVPSIFSFSSKVCGKCGNFDGCQRHSHASLLSVRGCGFEAVLLKHERYAQERALTTPERVGVHITLPQSKVDAKPVKVKLDISVKQREVLDKMPPKVAAVVRKIWQRGIDLGLLEAALRGENPFPQDGFRSLHVAFRHLLEGGFTRPFLRTCFVEELGWKKNSAQVEVNTIWSALCELGIAEESGCALVVHPKVRGDNKNINYFRVQK